VTAFIAVYITSSKIYEGQQQIFPFIASSSIPF